MSKKKKPRMVIPIAKLTLLPKKKKAGRKRFDGQNPEFILSKLRDAWDIGCTDMEAAWHAGISISALDKLFAEHTDLKVERDARKERMVTLSRAVLGKHLKKGDKQTAQWYLEKKKSVEFYGRQENINTNIDKEAEAKALKELDEELDE